MGSGEFTMSAHALLTLIAVALAIVLRLLFFLVPFTAKSGVMPKRWQLGRSGYCAAAKRRVETT